MTSKRATRRVGASALLVGVPVVAGTTLLSAAPAYAANPVTKTSSATQQFINGQSQTVTCTLTLTLITNDPNNPEQGVAQWAMTNSTDCLNAGLFEAVSWTTDNGGGASASESFSSPIPSSFQDVYEPVRTPTLSQPNFTDNVSVGFGNCMSNCNMALSLTANGKP